MLSPGALAPIHPIAFLVLTETRAFGLPVTANFDQRRFGPQAFGLEPGALRVTEIKPGNDVDQVGVVTTLEGSPLPSGDIAGRLGGWADVSELESSTAADGSNSAHDAAVVQLMLGSKNDQHNNYQDFQAFLDAGGHIGLQHDVLQYGAFNLNPFLVRVELVPMLVVRQGQVAVVKSYVGLPTEDTSGTDFKFGSIVMPGHRGIWREPLRTGKYALNPRVYAAEVVPTSILTLNWATANSAAHDLDKGLSSIDAKSREGFVFKIDLQVQIHVPDTKAPLVISMVGTMANLVNEVLQSAVGNYFRNSLQALAAVTFIETRDQVQANSETYVTDYLARYQVETRGVYIQDVVFPPELVEVLTSREIANQEKTTYEEQRAAQVVRVDLEAARGKADMQSELAQAQVSVDIEKAKADARTAQAEGEANYTERTGRADAVKVEAIGLAEAEATKAKGLALAAAYEAQRTAIGAEATAAVAVANAIADGHVTIVPEVLVQGEGGGGAFTGLAATLMGVLKDWGSTPSTPALPTAVAPAGAAASPEVRAEVEAPAEAASA